MQLGFFTMPIHPLGKDWRQSLREDRDAFILADELGFSDALLNVGRGFQLVVSQLCTMKSQLAVQLR